MSSVADSATTAETTSSLKANSVQEFSTDLLRVYYGKLGSTLPYSFLLRLTKI